MFKSKTATFNNCKAVVDSKSDTIILFLDQMRFDVLIS